MASVQNSQPSWVPLHTAPPPVKHPYVAAEALSDLPGVTYALETFLNSRMLESEEYCHTSDVRKERLYFATGYGLIQCVKGLMSYADEDLLSAINHTRHGNHIASQHRKKAGFFGSLIGSASSTAFIRSMTDMERHAELTYAESLFEKALLGIVYSGDWLAFIKEALNMRTVFGVYRHLGAFLDEADAAYAASLASASSSSSSAASSVPTTPTTASSLSLSTSTSTSTPPTSVPPSPSTATPTPTIMRPTHPEDPSIDPHFRSGVYLGVGMCNIILSLIPGKLATLVELFGYKGDRKLGLDLLMRAGGWDDPTDDEPRVSARDEGVRRPICDMALLIYHLVISSYTGAGVDISVAARVLEWNLKRFPNGVFFLFGAGRLALHRSQPRRAITFYTRAMHSQIQYRNLDHVSYWECALARLSLWEVGEVVPSEESEGGDTGKDARVGGSAACWRVLEAEATWSKAIYSYGLAVCLLEDWETDADSSGKTKAERTKEAETLMKRVPGARQKIAGKSIPLEKFVARKSRKFTTQHNRLLLPTLEIAYIFSAIAHAPRGIICRRMLPLVREALAKLGKKDPKAYEGGETEYWDDLCLARFLEGVCLRFVAWPDPDATLDPADEGDIIPRAEAEQGAEEAFKAVFEYGPKIELDHYIVYHAHYEYGRLLACRGDVVGAKREFELVLSGKWLEVGPSGRKGKYSMENALHIRTHAALDALQHHNQQK